MNAEDEKLVSAAQHISVQSAVFYLRVIREGHLLINISTAATDLAASSELETFGFLFRRPVQGGYEVLPTPAPILRQSLLHRLDWLYPPFAILSREERQRIRIELRQPSDNTTATPMAAAETLEAPRTLEGSPEIDTFVTQALHRSRMFCAVSAAEWSSNLPLVWSVVEQRLREGMQYRRIVCPLGLAAFGWEINDRDTRNAGVDLRVTLMPMPSPFYLFSSEGWRSVLAFVSPACGEAKPRATYTALGQLTDRSSEQFEALWRDSTPAQTILERLACYRRDYIKLALATSGVTASTIAGMLFDKGIFANLSASDLAVVPSLIEAGLVLESRYSIGLHHFVPHIINQIRRYCSRGVSTHA